MSELPKRTFVRSSEIEGSYTSLHFVCDYTREAFLRMTHNNRKNDNDLYVIKWYSKVDDRYYVLSTDDRESEEAKYSLTSTPIEATRDKVKRTKRYLYSKSDGMRFETPIGVGRPERSPQDPVIIGNILSTLRLVLEKSDVLPDGEQTKQIRSDFDRITGRIALEGLFCKTANTSVRDTLNQLAQVHTNAQFADAIDGDSPRFIENLHSNIAQAQWQNKSFKATPNGLKMAIDDVIEGGVPEEWTTALYQSDQE